MESERVCLLYILSLFDENYPFSRQFFQLLPLSFDSSGGGQKGRREKGTETIIRSSPIHLNATMGQRGSAGEFKWHTYSVCPGVKRISAIRERTWKKENWVEEKREGEREKSIMQRKNPTETVLMGRIPTFVTPAELRMGWKIKRNELSERGWGKWKQFQTTVHEPFRPGSNQRAEPGRPAVSTFEGESSPTWKGGKVQGVRDSPAKRVW